MRDSDGHSRSSNGAFTNPDLGVGTEAQQVRAGVNYSDTVDSATSKVFFDGFNRQPTSVGSAGGDDFSDGANAILGLKIVILAGIVCLFAYTVYKTYHAFVVGAVRSGQSYQAAPGYLDFPPEFINAPEAPITNGVTPEFARSLFVDKAKTFIANPAIVEQLANRCAHDCAQPSSADMVKYIPYVKPGQLQDYLHFACQKDQFNNLYIGQTYTMPKFSGKVVLTPTPTGCHIENYENFKTVYEPMKAGFQRGVEVDTAKLRKGGIADALKYGALLILELALIFFVGKRLLKLRFDKG